jgi:hypothetical protein
MKKELLEDLSRLISERISILKEEGISQEAETENKEETESLDVRNLKEGAILTIDFENVSIKFKKLSSEYDYWIVTEDRESVQLKKGDIVQFIKADGNSSESGSLLKNGKRIRLDIIRKANIDYLSNPIQSWQS